MKMALRTCVSAEVVEVAINPSGEIYALIEIKYKAFGYEKPDRIVQTFLNITDEIKKGSN